MSKFVAAQSYRPASELIYHLFIKFDKTLISRLWLIVFYVRQLKDYTGRKFFPHRPVMPVSRDIVSPIRLSGGMNKSMPPDGIDRYRVSPLKIKLDIKRKMLMLKHLQCLCIVSGRSCGPSPYIFGTYIFFSGPQFEKNWLRKLGTIALPVYFMILNFDYGIQ